MYLYGFFNFLIFFVSLHLILGAIYIYIFVVLHEAIYTVISWLVLELY